MRQFQQQHSNTAMTSTSREHLFSPNNLAQNPSGHMALIPCIKHLYKAWIKPSTVSIQLHL